jgi:hypothetical protein
MKALALAVLCAGCGTTLELERTVTPKDAERSHLSAVAIARGKELIRLPEGAVVRDRRVLMRGTNVYEHKLGPDDVIEVDEQGSILAVRTPTQRIEFKPKTATSPEGADYVRGELASNEEDKFIALEPRDRIVVRGALSVGDEVPGGGRVVMKRLTGALVFGSIAFSAAYLPAAIAGAAGSDAERVLVAPFGGPWAYLVTRPACVIDPVVGANCIPDTAARFGATMSGIFQSLGLIFIITGLPAHAAIAEPEEPDEEKKPSVSLVPLPNGIGLGGRF